MCAEHSHSTMRVIIQEWEGNIGFPPTSCFISTHLLSTSIYYQLLLCGISTLLPLPHKIMLSYNIQIWQANSGKDKEVENGNQ